MSEPGFIIGGNGSRPPSDAGQGTAPAAGDLIKEATDQSFMADVIEASRTGPVLVDFWAPWCGPCKQLTPLLEKAVKEAKGSVRLVKVNIDENPQVAGQLGIQSIPAVLAFSNGQPLDGFMGALPESQIKAFIEKIAGPAPVSQVDEALEAADKAFAARDSAGAAQLYAGVLQLEPENLRALAGLARCQIALGALDQAEAMLKAAPDDAKEPTLVAAREALAMAREAEKLGDPDDHAGKLEADPNDHAARLDMAKALAARGDKSGAVEALLEIIRRDREWNEDAARKELLRFFEVWGPKDKATVEGRRRLSTLLFA